MDVNQTIRQAMRTALKTQGLTQQAFAERLGISKSAVAQLLAGDYAKIPPSLLTALDALDLELVVQSKAQK